MKKFTFFAATLAVVVPQSATSQISKKEFPAEVDVTPGSPEDIIPPTFRGQITYRGFYRGKVFVSAPLKQLSLNGFLKSALDSKTLPMAGDITIVMEFNGNKVSGSTQATSSLSGEHGTPDPARFMGRREGATCYLSWNDGTDNIVYCGRSEYRENDNITNSAGQKTGFSTRSPAAEYVDFVERDRQRAVDQAKAQADRVKEVARLAALPRAGPASATKLAGYIQSDSAGWIMNHYDVGSLHNVRIAEGSVASRNYVLRGEYTFNSGESGWVLAKISQGSLECLMFWDSYEGCRAMRQPRSASPSYASSGGYSGGYSETRRTEIIEIPGYNPPPPPPPPPPMTPIGGNSGLYGDSHGCC